MSLTDGPPPSRAQCTRALLLGLSCFPVGALASWFAILPLLTGDESALDPGILAGALLFGSISAVAPFLVLFFWVLLKDRPRYWWLALIASAIVAFVWTSTIITKALRAG